MTAKTEPLTAFQKDIIKKAALTLKNLGCQYAIIDREGNRLGELVVVTKGKGKKSPRIHDFASTGYIPKVEALELGQSELFEAPDGVDPHTYRSSIAACANRVFGSGACKSHVEGNLIEIVRIA